MRSGFCLPHARLPPLQRIAEKAVMAFDASWIWPIAAAPVVGALLTLIVAGVPALRPQTVPSVRRPWPTIGDDDASDEIGLHAAAYSVAAAVVAAWAATAT